MDFGSGGVSTPPIFLVYSVTHFRIYCQGKIAFFIIFLTFLRKIAGFLQKNRENYFFFSVLGCEVGAKSRKNAPRQATQDYKCQALVSILSRRVNTKTGEISSQTQYGITSLTPQKASAETLLKLRRGHWTIENKVHWLRDAVLDEDASQARTGSIPEVMAALRNTVLSVLRLNGHTKIAETLRFFASKPKRAVKLI